MSQDENALVDPAAGKGRQDWGSSGLAYLTGHADAPPDFSRWGVLTRAQYVADRIARLTGVCIDAATTLAGRAAMLGLTRHGRISAGRATRLIRGRDGWSALTLSRADDIDAVPALVESPRPITDPWSAVIAWAAERSVNEVTDRARLLGIPAAVVGEASARPPRVHSTGRRRAPRDMTELLVVDMSSMWAGPLCGQFLAQAGATVVKVESPSRPDGTRGGEPAFFDWLNSGKLCFAADFTTETAGVRELLDVADIVVEGSRPAALSRRGLGPGDGAARPGRVWARVSGYGAAGEGADRVAFGDDAAAAGGLVVDTPSGPVFCADAIADPLTGLETMLAVLESWQHGGGEVIDVSMAAVAATYAELPTGPNFGDSQALPPQRPPPSDAAARLGADSAVVRQLVAERRRAAC